METIIGGDFNARTGEEGGEVGIEGEEARGDRKEESRSRSKDKKINKEGKMLVEFLEERGWGILNERTKGDEEREYTFVKERGSSVIDYVIGDEGIKDKVGRLEIENRIDSNHQPVEVWMKGKKWRRKKKVKSCRGVWSEEKSKAFVKRLKKKGIGTEREGVGVNGK